MIESNEKLTVYLNSLVNNVYKILPLYEEENKGIDIYVDSLLFDVRGLNGSVDVSDSAEYITILNILFSLSKEVVNEESKKATVKREVFKCIHTIKNMINRINERD